MRGEPGSGKTALLAAARGRSDGARVLAARGVEGEAEFSFAGLADLLGPVLDARDAIPARQSEALAAALALGPPRPTDRFAVAAATLSLLTAAARERPLLALVDDLQWLDAPSREALLFAARRLGNERVALLIATGGEPQRAPTGLPNLGLEGLDARSARALIDRHAPVPVPAAVAERLIAATGGNPLALIELPRSLPAAQLTGAEALAEPLAVGPAVSAAFRRRLDAQPAATRRALLVVAAGDGGLELTGAALATLGGSLADLGPAEAAGIASTAGGVAQLAHPLMRAVAYHSAPAPERRAAHAALAGAMGDERAEARAWQRAAAALGPDESAAAELEAVATPTLLRGGSGAAATALARAARLTPAGSERVRRLVRAGEASLLAGQTPRACSLLTEALAGPLGPVDRAEAAHLLGRARMWSDEPGNTHAFLIAEARRVAHAAPAPAAVLLTDAAMAPGVATLARAIGTARQALALAERSGDLMLVAQATSMLAGTLALGGHRRDALPILGDVMRRLGDGELAPQQLGSAMQLGALLVHVERYADARRLMARFAERARAASALAALPFPLYLLAQLDVRAGHWDRAVVRAAECVDLSADTGQDFVEGHGYALLARVEAARGDEAACREHARRALARTMRPGLQSVRSEARAALGLLALGAGDDTDAIAELNQVVALAAADGMREPAVGMWAADHVEALVRGGHRAEARRALRRLAEDAGRTGGRWARGVTARCRGLLAEGGDFAAHFSESRALLGGAGGSPYDRARSDLSLGERLRRVRRRREARVALQAALATFEALGARPWAERALRELRALGDRPRRRRAAAGEGLSPQESHVALLVARGATNREAAARLFLSPKTIETHLSSVYRKLGLRSRTELALRLAGGLEAARMVPSAPPPESPAAPGSRRGVEADAAAAARPGGG